MTSKGSKSRIKWEGDSNEVIRTWPEDVRQNFGGELTRLDNREEPLDSEPMGKVLPGVNELRDEHFNVLYRVMYYLHLGWIYILHAFNKTTQKTSSRDIKLTKRRLDAVKARKDEQHKAEPGEGREGEEKSA